MKKISLSIVCIFIAIIILSEPQIVTSGIKKGIELSIYSVIPALFPFMLLTNYMISHDLCQCISYFFYPFLSKIFNISRNGCFAVLIGFTGGYPMGAKTINDLHKKQLISTHEAQYLCTFCNNCSLSFLLNYIIYTCLNNLSSDSILPVDTKRIIAFVYLPAVIVGILNRLFFKKKKKYKKTLSIEKTNTISNSVVHSSIHSILNLCVYVICFSILVELIHNLSMTPFYKCIIVSLVEITSGCKYTSTHLPHSVLQLFILLFSCIFGGLSITMQSISQFQDKSLVKYYLIGKLETLVIFVIMFIIYQHIVAA